MKDSEVWDWSKSQPTSDVEITSEEKSKIETFEESKNDIESGYYKGGPSEGGASKGSDQESGGDHASGRENSEDVGSGGQASGGDQIFGGNHDSKGGPSEGGASKGSPTSVGDHDSEGGTFEGDGFGQGPEVNKGGTSGESKTFEESPEGDFEHIGIGEVLKKSVVEGHERRTWGFRKKQGMEVNWASKGKENHQRQMDFQGEICISKWSIGSCTL